MNASSQILARTRRIITADAPTDWSDPAADLIPAETVFIAPGTNCHVERFNTDGSVNVEFPGGVRVRRSSLTLDIEVL